MPIFKVVCSVDYTFHTESAKEAEEQARELIENDIAMGGFYCNYSVSELKECG